MDTTIFLGLFPEFSTVAIADLNSALMQANMECNGFLGVSDENRRNYMLGLYMAHLLALQARSQSKSAYGGRDIKVVESEHEKLEFFARSSSDGELTSTSYGLRLQQMRMYRGGYSL